MRATEVNYNDPSLVVQTWEYAHENKEKNIEFMAENKEKISFMKILKQARYFFLINGIF